MFNIYHFYSLQLVSREVFDCNKSGVEIAERDYLKYVPDHVGSGGHK